MSTVTMSILSSVNNNGLIYNEPRTKTIHNYTTTFEVTSQFKECDALSEEAVKSLMSTRVYELINDFQFAPGCKEAYTRHQDSFKERHNDCHQEKNHHSDFKVEFKFADATVKKSFLRIVPDTGDARGWSSALQDVGFAFLFLIGLNFVAVCIVQRGKPTPILMKQTVVQRFKA